MTLCRLKVPRVLPNGIQGKKKIQKRNVDNQSLRALFYQYQNLF